MGSGVGAGVGVGAAVGAGVSSTLFFVTLKNVNKLTEEGEDEDDE